MTYHALMYLACEQMVTGVGQLERKKWVTQPINKLCARELNNSRWKIFVLEFDNFELFNSNSCLVGILQLNTKIFQGEMSNTQLELSNSNAKMYFLRKFSKFDQQNIIVYLRMYFDMMSCERAHLDVRHHTHLHALLENLVIRVSRVTSQNFSDHT